ncbi:related to tetracycline resistance proteins [Cephalotrichum gorgonifer]|uniref:Related to tetracycline resistance proteins n=1 Tax=Cephalotrichum gorgonifer TaxID=2041049 RepID=A0AAE8N3N1_9PEZI|nr:related to tetracycline resistance proteins [Cephalotrichum gorgonifer]
MASGSNTCVVELATYPEVPPPTKNGAGILGGDQRSWQQGAKRLGLSGDGNSSAPSQMEQVEAGDLVTSDGPFVEVTEKWNSPPINKSRVGATFWSMMVMGANDAAYGALIPYLEKYYGLTYTIVSLVFLSPLVGYAASAILNNYLHLRIGQRGISMLCAGCHMAAYIIICLHPPYPVLVVTFILAGFGNGIGDAAWNAWMGSLDKASELLGFLHAFYGVGGVISPLIATTLITKANLPWYTFYYLMAGLSAVELAVLTSSFWASTGQAYRALHQRHQSESNGGLKTALFHMPAARVSWISAGFLLVYVGVEVALGGWIVTFMLQVRGGEAFASGMTAMGFWLGMTVGRAVLGFVTPRIGVKVAISSYITAAMGLQLLFWLVPNFYVSAVAVAFQGFFLGPLFPGIVLVASALLPRHLHVVVIGFAAAFGGCGAAILPFAVGVLAQASGVKVLQPIILALLGALIVLWVLLPRIGKKRE